MKKKALVTIATAATIMFTGAAAGKADAAAPTTTVKTSVYKYNNYKDLNAQLNQILKQYGFSNLTPQLQGQAGYNPCPAAPAQKPAAAPVQKPATTTQKPATTTQKPAAAPTQKTTAQKPVTTPSKPAASTGAVSAYEQKVVELTNAERAKAGLSALKLDTALSNVARKKSEDMKSKGYFSHTSPTYGSPFDMMKQFGISYTSAGENIAQGQQSPEEVVQAWMNSEGHRANIMNSSFTHIGVGHVAGGNYWTQMFIGK
ncbi:CAP domain-containing protein [Peribacillus alkalitolerans]|uniref:CAP domain-containing protein n=1 Tax=Peribacillus alkalitolerans TaxID=1550385 RepID=UPI0013D1EC45|nr:CAP domain-containing protein [Peribacillus alkalitolerans]